MTTSAGKHHVLEEILGCRLAVDVAGEGSSALVFLHGGGAGRTDWAAQLEHFHPAFRLVACDFPGHGASSTPTAPSGASISYLAAAIVELIERRGRKANVLIGHSMGCWVALEVYRRDPAKVCGIVLIECTRFPAEPAARDALLANLRRVGGKALLARLYPDMFLPQTEPARVAFCLQRVAGLSPPFIEKLIASSIEWDAQHMAETLRSLEVPLLILQSTGVDDSGRRRPLPSLRDSDWVQFAQRCAPYAQALLIANAGHFPHVDQSRAVNAAVEGFLNALSQGG
jgi:pimeloyl-ACP methyl ester carboxylesterase